MAWGDAQANPWGASELLTPQALADELHGGAAKPVVIGVVFLGDVQAAYAYCGSTVRQGRGATPPGLMR